MEIPANCDSKETFKNLDEDEKTCSLPKKTSAGCSVSRIQMSSLGNPSSYLYTINCGDKWPEDNLCTVAINSKNNILACGFENSEIHVFDLKSFKSKQVKDGVCQNLNNLTESLSTEEDEGNNSLLGPNIVLKRHEGPVYGLTFSSHHSLLLSCSEDSSVRAWSTENFDSLAVYGDENYPVLDITVSSNGTYFATASMDCAARLWSFERSQPLRIFAEHSTMVDNVKFHSNSKYIATTSDMLIQLWAVEDGRSLRSLYGHQSQISCIAFSPDGQHLASADESGCIKIWDIGSAKEIGEINGHTSGILSISYSKNSALIASGGFDKVLKIWDVKHCIDKQTSSNATELINKEEFNTPELVNCHSTESTLHYVNFRKKDRLLLVASPGHKLLADC